MELSVGESDSHLSDFFQLKHTTQILTKTMFVFHILTLILDSEPDSLHKVK